MIHFSLTCSADLLISAEWALLNIIMSNYSVWLKVPRAAVKPRLKIHANFPADIASKEQTLSGS